MTTHGLHILVRRNTSPCAGDPARLTGSDISTSLSWPSPGLVPPAEPSGEFSDLGKCPGKHSDTPTPDLCCFQVSMFAEPDSWWVLDCLHCQAPPSDALVFLSSSRPSCLVSVGIRQSKGGRTAGVPGAAEMSGLGQLRGHRSYWGAEGLQGLSNALGPLALHRFRTWEVPVAVSWQIFCLEDLGPYHLV